MDIQQNIGCYTAITLFITFAFVNALEVQRRLRNGWSLCFTVVLLLICQIVMVPVFGLLPIFWLYRGIVHNILKIVRKDRYAGLVKGFDVVHSLLDPSESLIKILLIFEYDQDRRDVFEAIKEIFDRYFVRPPETSLKFRSTISSFMGCLYFTRQKITVDDCVRKIANVDRNERALSKSELMQLMERCYDEPLPENGKCLWDVLVGTQPVRWNEDGRDKKVHYPVLFRVHHGIADGVSLAKYLSTMSDRSEIKIVPSERSTKERRGNVTFHTKNVARAVLLAPSSIFVNILYYGRDHNVDSLSGKIVLAADCEKSHEYFQKVKAIKNKLKNGTGFAHVVVTAFSASLENYFRKYATWRPPEYLTVALPMNRKAMQVVSGEPDKKSVDFNNSFFAGTLKMPMHVDSNDDISLVRRLEEIMEETDIIKSSVDPMVIFFFCSTLCEMIPSPLLKYALSKKHYTAGLSILPGPPSLCVLGNTVRSCLIWLTGLSKVDICFSVFTYGNKLQVGVNADQVFIKNQTHARIIVDGFYNYLDAFEEEVKSM